MPSNLEIPTEVIKALPVNDTYILDQTTVTFSEYPAVYQDFVADMFDALMNGLDKIKKYEELILIFPGDKEPIGMVTGFQKFCSDSNIVCKPLNSEDYFKEKISKGIQCLL